MNEQQAIEFKRIWQEDNLKTVCAFANGQGGRLFVGKDDNGQAVGLPDVFRQIEDIPNKIKNALGIIVNINLLEEDGKQVVEVDVPPYSVPISRHGRYYYRSGSTTQELVGSTLNEFFIKKTGLTWDSLPNKYATLEDIDRKAVDYFLHKSINVGRMQKECLLDSMENILENLNLLDENRQLKNAALLLFGKKPLRFFNSVQFRIGRFFRDDSDLIFQDEIDGNIIQMADKVVEILKSKYLTSPIHYEGLQRIERLEIPEDALREAIFNAIVHKDYTNDHIQMKVYDDHITLWNPGMLIDNYTVDTLLAPHSSRPRNRNIAATFYRAGFIESWGRGIQKIRAGFLNVGLKAPTFEQRCGGIWVTIPRNNAQENATSQETQSTSEKTEATKSEGTAEFTPSLVPSLIPSFTPSLIPNFIPNSAEGDSALTQVQLAILEAIQSNPQVTSEELSKKIKITKRNIEKNLKLLREKGVIGRIGADKTGYWQVLRVADEHAQISQESQSTPEKIETRNSEGTMEFTPSSIPNVTPLLTPSLTSSLALNSEVGDSALTQGQLAILAAIQSNPQITAEELSKKIKITKRNTEKNLKLLKGKNVIERIGSDKTGHWQIIANQNQHG